MQLFQGSSGLVFCVWLALPSPLNCANSVVFLEKTAVTGDRLNHERLNFFRLEFRDEISGHVASPIGNESGCRCINPVEKHLRLFDLLRIHRCSEVCKLSAKSADAVFVVIRAVFNFAPAWIALEPNFKDVHLLRRVVDVKLQRVLANVGAEKASLSVICGLARQWVGFQVLLATADMAQKLSQAAGVGNFVAAVSLGLGGAFAMLVLGIALQAFLGDEVGGGTLYTNDALVFWQEQQLRPVC
ncbi:hypothetical protein MY4038_010311 [Beauveria bassiana]